MNKNSLSQGISFIAIIASIIALLLWPKQFTEAGMEGIKAWAIYVAPSLLPFMILTRLFSNHEYSTVLSQKGTPFFTKLFGIPSKFSYIFLLGTLSGYPLGARMICDEYNSGGITTDTAKKLSVISLNCGAVFIFSTVAAQYLNNIKAGLYIWLSVLISSVIIGIMYNIFRPENHATILTTAIKKNKNNNIIKDAAIDILVIGIYIMLFFIIFKAISMIIKNELLLRYTAILLEITNGCHEASLLPAPFSVAFSAMCVAFGGLCIIFQCYSYLKKCKINILFIICIKTIEAALAFLLCLMFSPLYL